ncbi:MAG: cytochrome c5 family protein [Gammaproteobacteria bacterium]|nr:MAG: cytochrome c5 family protein [Gammaproteobacteria bacterium]
MSQLKKTGLAAVALLLALGIAGCGSESEEVKLTADQEKAMTERLAPAGEVVLEKDVPAPVAAVAAGPRSGEEIYTSKCSACHASGAAGAPKVGAAADWESRLAQGIETLYTHAIQGIRGMPAKGLCMDCSDEELHAAVDHMVENSK